MYKLDQNKLNEAEFQNKRFDNGRGKSNPYQIFLNQAAAQQLMTQQ